MSARILVTGGAGYIGSILVPALLDAGNSVTVLDNFMFRQNSLAHVCADPRLEIVRGDFRVGALLDPLIRKADVVIPLAAYVGAPLCNANPVDARAVNRDGILELFRKLSPAQQVLMPTTNSAYGGGAQGHACDETSPLRPISIYAEDKVEVEQALMARENSVSFRLATVFGMSPRMRLDLLVNDFTYRAVTDRFIVLFEAAFQRNYIHVRDVARAFLHGLRNFERMRGEIYNVGLSDANLTKLELCREIQKHCPDFVFLEAPVGKDPDQRNYKVSNAKLEATGFRPEFSLSDGIRELVKGFQMLRNSAYGNV